VKKVVEDNLTELMECLEFVEDPRVQGRSKHLLIDILVISVCAILCGAEGIVEIAFFGQQKESWLKRFLLLPCGIPSHDTIARVLSIIDPAQMEIAFGEWVETISAGTALKSISLDGKSSNGTERRFNGSSRPLHIVSAYSHELGLTLMESESRSSGLAESEAALDCLRVLNLKGTTIMADAGIGTKKVIAQIREQRGHYLVPVKANSSLSLNEITQCFAKNESKIEKTTEESHGRSVERMCRVLATSQMSEVFLGKWPDAKVIFEITRVRTEKDKRFMIKSTASDGTQSYQRNANETKSSTETIYYVSSLKLDPKQAINEVRKHWQIENKLHWVLDVAFCEDEWTVTTKRLARSLSLIRKIALNLIRVSKTKGSVRGRMKKAGWNDAYLEEILFGS